MNFAIKSLLGVVTAIGVGLAAVLAYQAKYRPHGSGTSAAVANRVIWKSLELPDGATDVTYHVDFGGCEAEFAIGEADFLSWLEAKGWTPATISTPAPYFEPVLLEGNGRLVQNGYRFTLPDGEGVYDADRSRAAFWVSTFP